MKRLKAKLRSAGGFTLAELLLSVLIMLLATSLLTETIQVATRHFFESRQESGAQLLCSSLATFLEDELSFADVTTKIETVGVNSVTKVDTIRSSAHKLGNKIRFGILPKDGAATDIVYNTIGKDNEERGFIVATSETYSTVFPLQPYYLPVGQSAYKTSSNSAYDLTAGLAVSWEDGRFLVTVSIYDADAGESDAPLTKSSFSVRPLSEKKA